MDLTVGLRLGYVMFVSIYRVKNSKV